MRLKWRDIEDAVARMCDYWQHQPVTSVYGIPTGGCFVALMVSRRLDLPMLDFVGMTSLVVDDLIDSGDTMRPYVQRGHHGDALFRKAHSPQFLAPSSTLVSGWIQFPWEHEPAPLDAAMRLLQFCDRPSDKLKSEADALLRALVRPHGRATLLGLLEISDADFVP